MALFVATFAPLFESSACSNKLEIVKAITTLNDDAPNDTSSRRASIHALIGCRDLAAPAVSTLASILGDHREVEFMRFEAARALGAIGPAAHPAVPILLKTLQIAPPEEISFRTRIVASLGEIGLGAREAIPALTHLVRSDKEPEGIRYEATKAIGLIGTITQSNVETLILALNSEATQFAAAEALARFRWEAKQALPALTNILFRTNAPGPELSSAAAATVVLIIESVTNRHTAISGSHLQEFRKLVLATRDNFETHHLNDSDILRLDNIVVSLDKRLERV